MSEADKCNTIIPVICAIATSRIRQSEDEVDMLKAVPRYNCASDVRRYI